MLGRDRSPWRRGSVCQRYIQRLRLLYDEMTEGSGDARVMQDGSGAGTAVVQAIASEEGYVL